MGLSSRVSAFAAAAAIIAEFNLGKFCHSDLRHRTAQFLAGDDIRVLAYAVDAFVAPVSAATLNTPSHWSAQTTKLRWIGSLSSWNPSPNRSWRCTASVHSTFGEVVMSSKASQWVLFLVDQ
jgi:hypothetical protein